MAIRVVFRTSGDNEGVFADPIPLAEARDWLRSRGRTETVITTASGQELRGTAIDVADEPEIAKWIALESMVATREIDKEPGYIVVRRAEGDYVSIRADRIESISAYVEDEAAPNDSSVDDTDPDEEQSRAAWPVTYSTKVH